MKKMNTVKKISVTLVISLLVFQQIPYGVFASTNTQDVENTDTLEEEKLVVFAEENDGEVSLYSDESVESDVIIQIPDDSEVDLLISTSEDNKDSDFTNVQYTSITDDTTEVFDGYVSNENVYSLSDAAEYRQMRLDNEEVELDSNDKTDSELDSDAETASGDNDVNSDTTSEEPAQTDTEEENIDSEETDSDAVSVEEEVAIEDQDKATSSRLSITASEETQSTLTGVALKDKTIVYEDQSTNSNALKSYSKGSILIYETLSDNWYEATVYVNGTPKTGYINKNDVENATESPIELKGLATKSPTSVYSKASTGSNALKSYNQGTVLQFETFSTDWYKATVYINGKPTTGYIHKNDVEESFSTQEQVNLKGIGTQSPTNVYATTSTGSKVLKAYSQGTILKYKTFSSDWYEATVYLNGKATTGYIHKNHVEEPLSTQEQQSLKGIGTQNPTSVYSKASTSSSILKTYSQGSILQYKTYSSDWYEATVYIAGKKTTGYIHKNHLEQPVSDQKGLKGIATQSSTNVYSKASTSSSALKSYSQGTILKYKTFSTNWYEATVYIKGKATTGYIHKNHVENAIDKQQTLSGIAKNSSTVIYSKASTSSSELKSYSEGSILKYKTFSTDWYEATVYIAGKQTTGYIHKNHVENAITDQKAATGYALITSTKVYSKANTGSNVLRSYSSGTLLKYKTFSTNWYEATVYIKGKATTGYIHKNHVEQPVANPKELIGIAKQSSVNVYSETATNSNVLKSYGQKTILQYETFISGWYKATVYVDGEPTTGYIHKDHVENAAENQEILNGYAAKSPTNIYTSTSTSTKVIKDYPIASELKFKTFTSNWYQATVFVDGEAQTGYISKHDISFTPVKGTYSTTTNYSYTFDSMVDIQMTRTPKANGTGTIAAGRNLVEYYVNPANFTKDSIGYYQFLVLSSPANLHAPEVNTNVLSNAGTLTGTAAAFIEAGNKYQVNEAYLIAHALHETGNGGSTLAKGVVVNGKTVYNMYGTAAYDGSAVSSGAQYAYDKGWFTPELAIVGGAEFVAKNYIARGQDTLYKMRWNPDDRGVHQYATHVSWAISQTTKMANIYNLLNSYTLVFDVPKFVNQPSSTGSTPPANLIELPAGTLGTTTTSGLNLRSGPSTGYSIVTSISNSGTKLEVLGTNGNGWYSVDFNGKKGWVSGNYFTVLNLLEVKVSALFVRDQPSGSEEIGILYRGNLISGILDSSNKLVKNGDWYQINYLNTKRWISGGSNNSYVEEK